MNSISIIGRIGKDIDLKYVASGSAIANFSIAVNQDYKKQTGEQVKKTSWFDIVAFGKTGENLNKFFSKGSMIGITGELEQQTWQDQNGANRSKIIIKMLSFTFIDKKSDNTNNVPSSRHQENDTQQAPQQQIEQIHQTIPMIDMSEDEIPF